MTHPHSGQSQSVGLWFFMGGAVFAALAMAVLLVRGMPNNKKAAPVQHATANQSLQQTAPTPGVHARITVGDVTVERTLPSMSFALTPDQSLDARLPAGAFEGEFTVTFHPGNVREGWLGAEIQGGSVIIMQKDRPPLGEGVAGAEPQVVMSRDVIRFSRRGEQVTYLFRSDGTNTARLRAVWRPIESQVPLPLPSAGAPLLASQELQGMALVQQLNCTACHQSSDAELQAQLNNNSAPLLGGFAQFVRAQWIQEWITDPHALNPQTTMPRMFHGKPGDEQQIQDLTHFLVSMGGPMEEIDVPLDSDMITTGLVNYHTIGCFACHGPLAAPNEIPGGHGTTNTLPLREYAPLGRLAFKTNTQNLAEFLRHSVLVRPNGRMPSMNLSELEAQSIATYLIAHDQQQHPRTLEPFELDHERAARGRDIFVANGCANCHAMGPFFPAVESTLTAPSLESLSAIAEPHGCIAPNAVDGLPHFPLTSAQRALIAAFLHSLPHRKTNRVPHDQLALDIARLNCTACHQYHSERGPELALLPYFSTIAEADLGDEGRIPPKLGDVGARLNPHWIHEVLTEAGTARPYMGVRMPQFGEANVGHLPELFAAAAGVAAEPDHGPTFPSEYASIGRELVGSKGLNCIQCHNVAGRESTGTPGPDLAHMAERLRYDNFAQWLHNPTLVRPGTRMPSFFVNGQSGITDLLDGAADKQIDAIWAYLSQGEHLPLPEGLVDPSGLSLQVIDEPIVFRSFLKQAGVRAIACGYPEQIHCAFDAENCRLAAIWEGEFLNAKGAWAARGGTETNPAHVQWTAPNEPTVRIAAESHSSTNDQNMRFRGYRFDDQRRPIFMYDVEQDGTVVSVNEQPIPSRERGKAKLIRRFTLQGPAGLMLEVLGQSVTLDASGAAQFDVETTWQ